MYFMGKVLYHRLGWLMVGHCMRVNKLDRDPIGKKGLIVLAVLERGGPDIQCLD